MSNRQKALELLKYIESQDQEFKDLISLIRLSNYGIMCAKTKLEILLLHIFPIQDKIMATNIHYSLL